MDATTISHQSDESSWKFGDRSIRGIDYEIVTEIYDSRWRASWQSRTVQQASASLKRIKPLQELRHTYHCFSFFLFGNVLTVAQKPSIFSGHCARRKKRL